jgi:hypothetical protein
MRDLGSLAQHLRLVQRAQRRFLRLWKLENVLVGPTVLDRVAADVRGAKVIHITGGVNIGFPPEAAAPGAKPRQRSRPGLDDNR